MYLSRIATIKTNFPEAQFWIVRRGSANQCGKPTREYNTEHIGIYINRTDLLLPDYLFYMLIAIHNKGEWEKVATGSLSLVNIKTSDIKKIKLNISI